MTHTDFCNKSGIHLGNIETTLYNNMRIRAYNQWVAQIDLIALTDVEEIRKYFLAEIEVDFNEIYCAIKARNSAY